MVKENNSNSSENNVGHSDEPAEFQLGFPDFETIGHVEWDTPTRALAEFLAAVGVRDPGRVARSLMHEFGSLSDVLSATWWRLFRVVGRELARKISSSHGLMKAMLEERITEGVVIERSQALIDLLQTEIGFLRHERLVALFVDARQRLMRIERLGIGSHKEASLDLRTVVGCALTIGADGVVLVHNHPSGIPRPSAGDINVTNHLKKVLADFDITLLDHLIVARGELGTIQEYWQDARFNQGPSDNDVSSGEPFMFAPRYQGA